MVPCVVESVRKWNWEQRKKKEKQQQRERCTGEATGNPQRALGRRTRLLSTAAASNFCL